MLEETNLRRRKIRPPQYQAVRVPDGKDRALLSWDRLSGRWYRDWYLELSGEREIGFICDLDEDGTPIVPDVTYTMDPGDFLVRWVEPDADMAIYGCSAFNYDKLFKKIRD